MYCATRAARGRILSKNLVTQLKVALVIGMLASVVAARASELTPVPHPNIDTLTPEVRRSLAPAIEQFELSSETLTGTQLGRAFGKLGLHYQAHQQQAAARVCYENAMALDPESYQWPYYLAVHFEESGELGQAAAHYRQSLNLNPQNVAGITRLGLLFVEADDMVNAEKLLRVALDADPENAAAFAGLGAIEASRKNHAEAVQYYQKALGLQPESTQLYYRLGLAYRELGELTLAREALAKRGPRIPSIRDPLLSLMQAFTRPATDYLAIGSEALANGEVEKAAAALSTAITIDPRETDAMIELGRLHAAQGRADEALRQFERVLEIENDNAAANLYAGMIYEMRSEDNKAIRAYTSAAASNPDLKSAHLGIANTLMRQQRYAAAAEKFSEITTGESQSSELWFWQGMAWLAARRCSEAEQALLTAFELAPGNGFVIHALVRTYSTCPGIDQERRKTALAYADLIYTRDPGLDTAETLAMALAANSRFGEAEELQFQAIFEATKLGNEAAMVQLRDNLERYRKEQTAVQAWPADHPAFMPIRSNASGVIEAGD